MPDISMCDNQDCFKKELCWRYMAVPSQYQSYSEFKNICNEENDYKWFYEIGNKPIKKEQIEDKTERKC